MQIDENEVTTRLERGEEHVHYVLKDGDQAWNPDSPDHPFEGPIVVVYRPGRTEGEGADGPVDVSLFPA